ncbi:relaxin receptor 2-like [Oppia nitens]|uniref:relaxin receptor 2-like n=1 Tax=Oppia nitens TaxID=1686743 RepID=UPI0023DB0BE6|nr:relaxin receptor 2-like [Oppia nitens]
MTGESTMMAPCGPGYFLCNNSTICLKRDFQCNNNKDCPDGSDELNCEDEHKKRFYNELFRKRPDEDREKRKQEGCQLNYIPDVCNCSTWSLFCEHQNLIRVPPDLPSDIKDLDLSGNNLTQLSAKSFPKTYTNLSRLILTAADIMSIERKAFHNMKRLQYLYLSGNKLSAIRSKTFHYNSALELLVLSHNPINNLESKSFEGLTNLTELDLRDCRLKDLPQQIFDPLRSLTILWLDGNQLNVLLNDVFSSLPYLETLSLSRNQIQYVDSDTFWGLNSLRSLSLASNSLTYIGDTCFGELNSLLKLDLSNNQIHTFGPNSFIYLNVIESLDLRKNPFRKFPTGIFNNLTTLTHIYFDDFKLCSYAMHVRICEPRGDGISSFQHLLDNVILRVSVWIVALVACVGNLFVLIGRMMMHEMNEVHSFFIKNLALADLVMSVYLFIIAYYDNLFRGEYIRHEERWRGSWQCILCGLLSTISSEASVFTLTIITIDRYLSVLYPFSLKRRTKLFAMLTMTGVWLLSILLAIVPLLDYDIFGTEFYTSNGVCLALQIHDPYSKGWEYSMFLFCGINSVAFAFITYAYISMSSTITSSAVGLRTTQQKQDRNIAKRCGFIVATDCLCWMPIVVIKVLALAGVPINDSLYAVIAIFLLPVNSALNPVLYTLTTKLFKQHFSKIMTYSLHLHRSGSAGDQHSGTSYSTIITHSRNTCKRSVLTISSETEPDVVSDRSPRFTTVQTPEMFALMPIKRLNSQESKPMDSLL